MKGASVTKVHVALVVALALPTMMTSGQGVREPVHRDPMSVPVERLRKIQASLAGVYVEALKPQCPGDPTTGIRCVGATGATARGLVNGLLFTPAILIYPRDLRERIYHEYFTVRKLTHFPVHIPCIPAVRWYHGIYPPVPDCSGTLTNQVLHEIWDRGGIPICFTLDDADKDGSRLVKNLPARFDKRLCRLVVGHWEHFEDDCAMGAARAYFGPAALLYWHNPVTADRGQPDACWPGTGVSAPDNASWFRHARDAYGLQGILLQTGPGDVAKTVRRIAELAARLGGCLYDWPCPSNGYEIDVVWFEDTNTVYENFWRGGNEANNIRRSDEVLRYMTKPLCLDRGGQVVESSPWCGLIKGFGSGGTAR